MTADTDDDDSSDDYPARVLLSFDVFSSEPIEELSEFLRADGDPDASIRYDFGSTVNFTEEDSSARADRLRDEIDRFLDQLSAVPREKLHADGALVRLFMTLPGGPHTLFPETVQRLAEVNATVWIDQSR